METRPLGRTDLEVSAIGFGAWGMGGDRWRDVPPREAQRALAAAIDAGLILIDTALVYGDGESEQRVGHVIRELGAREEVVLATKVPPADGRWPARPGSRIDQVFPVAHLTASVDASLANLGVEAIDLEQLHVWRDEWLDQPGWGELCDAMERLTRDGKVRHFGISVNDHAPDSALRALDDPHVASVQVIYNIFDPSAADRLLTRAAERRVGVIARCPFDEGALTGAITAQSRWPAGEFRARYFAGERAAEVEARVARLRPLLGDEARTLAELALRFALAHPAVSSVLAGMRRAEHVAANLAVADGRRLSAGLLERLAAHRFDKNWYPIEGPP